MKTVLTGITKNLSGRTKEDGELSEMLNLRHDGAILRPIGVPEGIKFLDIDKNEITEIEEIVFVHVFKDRRFWLSYSDGWLRVYGEQEGELQVNVNPVNILKCDKPNQVFSMGSIVIVNNEDSATYIDNTDGIYNVIRFDALDDIGITIQQYEREFLTDEYKSPLGNVWDEGSNSDIYEYLEKYNSFCGEGGVSYFGKAKKEAEENGFATNVLLLRYGFKMFDGSYLKLSPIRVFAPTVYMGNSDSFIESCVSLADPRQSTAEQNYYKVYGIVTGLNLSARVQADISKFDSVLLKYVDSLDFFISEVPLYDGEDQTSPIKIIGKETTAGSYFHLQGRCLPFKKDGLAERIGDASIYYKVASLELKSFKSENFIDLTKDILNIEQQDYLKEFQPSSFNFKSKGFVYNNSLHVFNIEYNPTEGVLDNYGSLREGVESKTKITLSGAGSEALSKYSNHIDSISPILIFDGNFKSLLFESVYKYQDGTKEYRKGDFFLENNLLSNTSSLLIKTDIEGVSAKFAWVATNGGTIENKVKNIKSFVIPEHFTLNEVDAFEFSKYETYAETKRDPNKMKVSATNNPFYFPIEQTYEIGQGEIKGLGVANTALSQGQFGQFPLYVFCSDGIYAMNVGTDVAYSNSSPVSRDTITGDLISIDKAVAFISDRGLKILQGEAVTDVSLAMQSNSYEEKGERFEDFIKGAKLAYNYFFGEIYLLREDKEFAYVYELKNQTWSKRDLDYKGMFNVYPDLYIQDEGGKVHRLSRELSPDRDDAPLKKIKFRTRPMKWGDGFKKVARMIIRGLVIGNWDIKILASNDGVNFHEIRRASITTDTPKRDIPFGRISGSFKSYVLEIEADMDERAYIEYVETELQDSIFNKKIR